MAGRHSKPAFHRAHAAEIKTVGGIISGAAIAGVIAASAAVTTPHTSVAAAADGASQPTLADIAVLRTDERPASPHEAHRDHTAHKAHKERKAKSERKAKVRRVSADQVLDLARDQIGTSEDKSGETKFNKWFADEPRALRTIKRDGGSRAAYKDAAWCDMFVSWVGNRLGVSGTVGFDAWAVKHAEWFKDHDRWGHQPRPGAVTFFGWGGNSIDDIEHVGFTIKDNGDGTIKTVEGNTKNTVAIRKRDKSSVVGYGYPDYKK